MSVAHWWAKQFLPRRFCQKKTCCYRTVVNNGGTTWAVHCIVRAGPWLGPGVTEHVRHEHDVCGLCAEVTLNR